MFAEAPTAHWPTPCRNEIRGRSRPLGPLVTVGLLVTVLRQEVRRAGSGLAPWWSACCCQQTGTPEWEIELNPCRSGQRTSGRGHQLSAGIRAVIWKSSRETFLTAFQREDEASGDRLDAEVCRFGLFVPVAVPWIVWNGRGERTAQPPVVWWSPGESRT